MPSFTGKRLFLLRHASTAPRSSGSDIDRVLSPQGHADAAALGAFMSEKGYIPDAVLCSPAPRTRQTLEEVRKSVDMPMPVSRKRSIAAARVTIWTGFKNWIIHAGMFCLSHIIPVFTSLPFCWPDQVMIRRCSDSARDIRPERSASCTAPVMCGRISGPAKMRLPICTIPWIITRLPGLRGGCRDKILYHLSILFSLRRIGHFLWHIDFQMQCL